MELAHYVYLADGKVDHQDYANGVRATYGYDGRGFVSSVAHRRAGSQTLTNRNYYRDDRDRIWAWQKSFDNSLNPREDGRGDRYAYDAEGQLTEAYYHCSDPAGNFNGWRGGDVQYYGYDALGNRKGFTWSGSRGPVNYARKDNGLNQYRSWSPSVINYDDDIGGTWGSPAQANGVVMQDGNITAGYNAMNQIMLATSGSLSPNWMFFGYDPLGRCVKRWTGALTPEGKVPAPESNPATYYYYDGWNLMQEGPATGGITSVGANLVAGGAGGASRIYIHGARIDEIVTSINLYTLQVVYHQYDALNNCSLLTGDSGNIVEQYEYDAFGWPYVYDGAGIYAGSNSPLGNRLLFQGREWLSELKLYDFRNRMYQPELGRFMQPDPKHFAAGDYNLYRYCHNDPVNRSDPMGLDAPIVVVKDPERKSVIEAHVKDLLKVPAFGQHFDNTKKNNVVRDAQSPENKTLGRSPNGLKTNNTVRDFGLPELFRDLLGLFGRHTDYGTGATSFYDPSNRQTAKGGDREPIFGLANELGEMINANNGTWGLPNSTVNENRSIWYENQARAAYGAEPRPYH